MAQALDDTVALAKIANADYRIAITGRCRGRCNLQPFRARRPDRDGARRLAHAHRNQRPDLFDARGTRTATPPGVATRQVFSGVTGRALSDVRIRLRQWRFHRLEIFYTAVTDQAYSAEELDYDGGGLLTRAAFSGVTELRLTPPSSTIMSAASMQGRRSPCPRRPARKLSPSYRSTSPRPAPSAVEKFSLPTVVGQPYASEEQDFQLQHRVLPRSASPGLRASPIIVSAGGFRRWDLRRLQSLLRRHRPEFHARRRSTSRLQASRKRRLQRPFRDALSDRREQLCRRRRPSRHRLWLQQRDGRLAITLIK